MLYKKSLLIGKMNQAPQLDGKAVRYCEETILLLKKEGESYLFKSDWEEK